MSISDKARKIAQSFLTLDDIVLGQSLAEGGLSQVGRVGFSASGPSVALNVASRFVCLGAQVATRAAGLPLRGEAGALAGKMSNQAKKKMSEAKKRFAESLTEEERNEIIELKKCQ